jgi:hypothetical protein
MLKLQTISDINEAIAPLGFKISSKSTGGLKFATYESIDTELEKAASLANRQRYWQPLFDWRIQNKLSLLALKRKTGITGLL